MTNASEYLTLLFRELERLHPTIGSAASHGIAWDCNEERLLLLFNVGDCVIPLALHPSDLTSDPIATAATLAGRGEAENRNPDVDLITFKR